ncbi:MAG: hypothetical protein ACYS0C_05095 [Planctomycetota bacterium]
MKAPSTEIVFFRVSKLLCITFFLFAASVADAAPTITNCNRKIADCTVSLISDVHTPVVPELTQITEYGDSCLAAVAAEFIKPPAGFTDLAASSIIHVKSLPAVPGALFMVLTGFLCVSLVKDRRIWLTVLAGLLWAGQAGVQALPQLALLLSHRTHTSQDLSAKPTQFYLLENSARARSDIEGTRYIGLLHHLAGIPHANSASNRYHTTLIKLGQDRQKVFGRAFSHPNKNTFPPPSAIILRQHSLNALFKCLASRAEQFTCFSPAFIFAQLPRGPPLPARELFLNI